MQIWPSLASSEDHTLSSADERTPLDNISQLNSPTMNKHELWYWNIITPSVPFLSSTWLCFTPICWLSGRTMTGPARPQSQQPTWQGPFGAWDRAASPCRMVLGCWGSDHCSVANCVPPFLHHVFLCQESKISFRSFYLIYSGRTSTFYDRNFSVILQLLHDDHVYSIY